MANDIEDIRLNGTRYGINDERLATKAEQDGFYEEMTVGDAEQLVSTKYVNDAEPYNFRTTGGSADAGNREYLDRIVGGTVAWNQLAHNGDFANNTNWDGRYSIVAISDGIATVTVDSAGTLRGLIQATGYGSPIVAGHHYLIAGTIKAPANGAIDLSIGGVSGTKISVSADTWTQVAGIWTASVASSDGRVALYFYQSLGQGAVIQYKNVICVDLTQMFGATIANYIYSLEQATAGAGVAFFRKMFPKPYYAYNAGELISVKALSHNTVGFNQWDEQWEVGGLNGSTGALWNTTDRIRSKNYIKVLPSTSYYIHYPASGIAMDYCFYDADKTFISSGNNVNSVITTPTNAHYMKFATYAQYGTTYNNDICINLSWSGYRNGEYEPYVEHEYALDSDLELRGIPKLDASNNLYYDGDEYPSDGDVTRKYGIVDLGTLSWLKQEGSTEQNYRFSTQITGATTKALSYPVCAKYVADSDPVYDRVKDKVIILSSSYLFVEDTAYTTAADFKAAMSGVYLVYELAEPTTETADAYNEIQICDDFGTEEFVDTRDIPVPVGHETRYPANLRDKLQHLPDLADADGYYMIQQSNNDMSLIRFRIPQAPAEDGEYTLKATVSGGTPTYTWESTESEGE